MSEFKRPSFFVGCDIRKLSYERGESDPYIGTVDAWPQHITLLPPVEELDGQLPDDVFREFAEIAKRTAPFRVIPIRDAMFGEDGETEVTIVEDLKVLHFALLGVLHAYGYDGQYPEMYTGKRYSAHTSRGTGILPPADAITLDSMSIFRKRNGKRYIQERLQFVR